MMLIVTKQDLTRMPAALRDQLMSFMFETKLDLETENLCSEVGYDDFYQTFSAIPLLDREIDLESRINIEPVLKTKTVIDIDEEQVEALLANLSEKSIETLRLFASGEPVVVNTLVGDGCPYASFLELKRSFVGPVNRRLRTVTQNRSAALFRKAAGGEHDIRISVKPRTAEAIQNILIDTQIIATEE